MTRRSQFLFKCLTVGLLTAIVVLSVVPAGLRPVTGAPHDFEHAAAFALLGLVMVPAYRWRARTWIVLGTLFAAAIELAQLAIPSRHARLEDFLVDAASILVGCACATLLEKLSRRHSD